MSGQRRPLAKALAPEAGGKSPVMTRASVDLPDPLSPTTASVWPGASETVTSESTSTAAPGYRALPPSTVRIGSAGGASGWAMARTETRARV